jgi:uncharacterized RDD family membrane protein YckC
VTTPPTPAPENPARWAADPLGRHQYRYWDGAQWTEHVSDNGLVGVDPPVREPAPTSFGATHLGAPLPGTGASATPSQWTQQPASSHDATAVLGRRYGAFFIDAAISLFVFGVIFFGTANTHSRAEMLRMPGCHLSANDSSQVECDDRAVVTVNDTVYETEFGAFAGLCVLFTLLYFALMEGLTGATAGKHMTGLRVVTPDGARIGFPRALVRWLVFAVDGPLTLFLCGIITSAVSSGHRRLGDMAAGSYVIGRAEVGQPVSLGPR